MVNCVHTLDKGSDIEYEITEEQAMDITNISSPHRVLIRRIAKETLGDPDRWGYVPEVQAKYLAELLLAILEPETPNTALTIVVKKYEEG
jgi:hypothetical protein